jgi:hypothetical protein
MRFDILNFTPFLPNSVCFTLTHIKVVTSHITGAQQSLTTCATILDCAGSNHPLPPSGSQTSEKDG